MVQHWPRPSLWFVAVLPFVDWSDITAVFPGLMLSCFPGICSHCTTTCVPRSGIPHHPLSWTLLSFCFHMFSSSFSEKVALKVVYFLNFLTLHV